MGPDSSASTSLGVVRVRPLPFTWCSGMGGWGDIPLRMRASRVCQVSPRCLGNTGPCCLRASTKEALCRAFSTVVAGWMEIFLPCFFVLACLHPPQAFFFPLSFCSCFDLAIRGEQLNYVMIIGVCRDVSSPPGPPCLRTCILYGVSQIF